jgi:hypothetical protein
MAAPDVRPRVQSTTDAIDFAPSYPPGWFDRLIDWIDRLPGPPAPYLVALLIVQALYVTTVIWWKRGCRSASSP